MISVASRACKRGVFGKMPFISSDAWAVSAPPLAYSQISPLYFVRLVRLAALPLATSDALQSANRQRSFVLPVDFVIDAAEQSRDTQTDARGRALDLLERWVGQLCPSVVVSGRSCIRIARSSLHRTRSVATRVVFARCKTTRSRACLQIRIRPHPADSRSHGCLFSAVK